MVSIQKERLTRRKHHWGKRDDFRRYYIPRLACFSEPIDLVVECFSSDKEIKNIKEYDRELEESIKFRDHPRKTSISHHLAHLYSTFYLSPYDEAAVMVVDFQGSPVRDFTEDWPQRDQASPELVEVSSFYYCDQKGSSCLGKQLWDTDGAHPVGLGAFYCYLSSLFFPGEGNEGKVMGLAPYGDPQVLGLPALIVEDQEVFIPAEWLEVFREPGRFHFFRDGSGSFKDCADLAAAGQLCFEDALMRIAEWLYQRTKAKALCFTGGTALNCVANGRLLRESSFKEVFVPPSPHDGGTALGCAIYGLIEGLGVKRDFRWVNDFLGPELQDHNLDRMFQQEKGIIVERPENLSERIVDLLTSGQVVGCYQGRSELGPRALGHRSILADPRDPAIRTFINQQVKGRELFRPLAPVVLEEAASRFFEIDRPVPFMQFAVAVRPEQRAVIPAVTHVDGSARLQTLNEQEDSFLYSLLKGFEARTGIGVLLNTSLNGPGEPIVETPAEAIACFKSTALHALAMPPFLLRKEVEATLNCASSTTTREIAVTFDDLPWSYGQPKASGLKDKHRNLLESITANHVPTVGFVIEGVASTDQERTVLIDILRMWLDAGLSLGNHTFSHSYFYEVPLPLYEQDVIRGERIISELLRERDLRPRYFRYPYLSTGPNLEAKEAFEKFLDELDYQVAPVTISSMEWLFSSVYESALSRGDLQTTRLVAESYVPYMERVVAFFEGLAVEVLGREIPQILLLHAGWLNANYFAELCAMLKRHGYAFISLEQALRDPAYRMPDNYIGPMGISWLQRWALTRGNGYREEPELPQFMKQFDQENQTSSADDDS